MKITKLMRVFLILLSVVMVLPLFACGDTPEETTTKAPEETTAPKAETTEAPKAETTENKGEEPTEESESVTTDGTTESGSETTTESGSETTETSSETDSETTETSEETTTAEPACEHKEVEDIPAVAPTCTTDGSTAGKKCSECGEVIVEPTVIPAAHTLTEVPANPATCTENGNVAYKHCSVCNKNFDAEGKEIADVVVPAAHKKVDKTYTAATTTAAGWKTHTICEVCEKVWDEEGNEIDAVPTIPVIVPATEQYWGVEEISKWTVNGPNFKAPVLSEDRSYVRFERDGDSADGNVVFMSGNSEVTGQYFVLKYRTDHATEAHFWANTTYNGHEAYVDGVLTKGQACGKVEYTPDSKWHIVVFDLSILIRNNYVKTNDDGEYVIQWARIDLLDIKADSGYFDVAYAALCSDLTDVASILQVDDGSICPHASAEVPVYTPEGDKHYTSCIICGTKFYEAHRIISPTWDAEAQAYKGTCICNETVESKMLYVTESYSGNVGLVGFGVSTGSDTDGTTYTRYTATTETTDPFFYFYRDGRTVTGKYAVVRYRLINNNTNVDAQAAYAGSVMSSNPEAAGNGDSIGGAYGPFVADGQWRVIMITIPETNTQFEANGDDTYSWKYLRSGFMPAAWDGSCYMDVDYIAFADNVIACENFAYDKNPTPPIQFNFENVNNTIDGATFLGDNIAGKEVCTIDVSQSTLTTPTSLELCGWVCTPGGVASYYYRVVKVDGEAVDEQKIDWTAIKDRTDIYTAIGAPKGYSEACAKGAGFDKSVVDLTKYAGHTVDFELVAVTNFGAEIVFANVINVTVPTVQAE